mgnify:CR=1 FL=1
MDNEDSENENDGGVMREAPPEEEGRAALKDGDASIREKLEGVVSDPRTAASAMQKSYLLALP